MVNPVLQHFGVSPGSLLGKGSESQVYALDQARVLRLYPADASLAYIEARQRFYMQLAARNPPFTIPTVLSHGVISSHPYTVEQRIHGREFARVLPRLTGADRARALASYLDLAMQIGTIQFPDASFGELIFPEALQRETWPQFLWDRAQQILLVSRADLEQDVPQLGRLLEDFHTRVLPELATQTKALVHGDYFPGNVFIDDMLRVHAVGDFGYSTVVGDPRMDVAGAIVFLEVVEGYHAADTGLLLDHLRASGISAGVIDAYRLYYSLYFSHCKHTDPPTYAWCIKNLHMFAAQLPTAPNDTMER